MNNNNIWGPPAWTFLHTVTFNYPENPTEDDKRNFYNFFMNLQHVLPCEKCKAHYKQNIKKYDLKNNLGSRQDLVKWLIDLHLVRYPVGSESRLVLLLQLLVNHFGIRRSDGYFLPFHLGHSRMAELIGSTRSTVSRLVNVLRSNEDLHVCKSGGNFLLSPRLVESSYINWIQ